MWLFGWGLNFLQSFKTFAYFLLAWGSTMSFWFLILSLGFPLCPFLEDLLLVPSIMKCADVMALLSLCAGYLTDPFSLETLEQNMGVQVGTSAHTGVGPLWRGNILREWREEGGASVPFSPRPPPSSAEFQETQKLECGFQVIVKVYLSG